MELLEVCVPTPVTQVPLVHGCILHHGALIVVSPPGCEKAHQGQRNQDFFRGGACPKATFLQMNLRHVAALGVIDTCSISGKDVYLALWKIQLDQSSCFVWTQESQSSLVNLNAQL